MFERLAEIDDKYTELSALISDPQVIADQNRWRALMKEHSALTDVVAAYREYKKCGDEMDEAQEMMGEAPDEEFKLLLKNEMKENAERREKLAEELKILLLPKDPNDGRNVFIEIRGGAGGDEAALFAGDLFRMYSRYAERRRWKAELMNSNESDLGGFKEVVFMVNGGGAYSRFKYESGVHRVQRIPTTESGGRIHTSTVTVAVLPEVDDVEVSINPTDLQIDTFRAGGAGGQHVNKTESAIRITHLPSGLVVECQDERSQHKNKDRALKILRSRLYEMSVEEQRSEIASARKSQVGTGDRSERIRTYNYPQGRISDHRINMTIYRLEDFLNGDIDETIDALSAADRAEKLASAGDMN